MKKIISTLCVVILLLGATGQSFAKSIYKNEIKVNASHFEQKGDSLYIDMQIDLSNLKIDRQRSLTVTPQLVHLNHTFELPSLLINGAVRHKAYKRSVSLKKEQPVLNRTYAEIKSKKNNDQLRYVATIPYQTWMDKAQLTVKEDLCGCGGEEETGQSPLLTTLGIQKEPAPILLLSYIEPKKEELKIRTDKWETALDFPVNKTTIYPDYMNNLYELSKAEETIKSIKSDPSITINNIDIMGYASPEGSIENNKRLSVGRAEALKEYLSKKIDIPANLYHVEYGGENWDGLVSMLKVSDIRSKDELLAIIEKNDNVNTRKNSLKALNKGVPYHQILTAIYPKLRKVICSVNYTIKNFGVDEAKTYLNEKAKQLSMNEMYQIANTYTEGSDAFVHALETAVRTYPDDPIANLNYAAALLSRKDVENAQRYLDRSDKNSPQYFNNLGVFYLLSEDSEKAKDEFEKAAKAGEAVAKINLRQMK